MVVQIVSNPPKSYQQQAMPLRMQLIKLLARPHLGSLSWDRMMLIEKALWQIDRHADSMDREANLGKYVEQSSGDAAEAK